MHSKPRRIADSSSRAVTEVRAKRLYQLLQLLAKGPHSRAALARRLHLDTRGFYRDLKFLRGIGILLTVDHKGYALKDDLTEAVARLPLPDPQLSLDEARRLARGKSQAHRKLQECIDRVTHAPAARR